MDKLYLDLDFAVKSAFLDLELIIKGYRNISVPFLCGAPGGGKSSIIKNECDKRGWNLLVKNMALCLYEELSGIPEVIKNKNEETYAVWSKPEIIEKLEKLSSNGKPTICFFDDWHRTNGSIQSMGFELFTDYTLKGFKIPDNVAFILAGNDSVVAGAREQLSAVMNRVSKKYVRTNYEHWKANFAIPNNINPIILGFLDVPENQSRFFHMSESAFEPWASPRSWTYLSTKMNIIDFNHLKYANEELVAEFSSYVGTEAASNLIQHWIFYKTVDTKKIFDTGNYTIPDDMISRYIFSYAICYEYIRRYETQEKNKASIIFGKILTELYSKSKESGAILVSQLSIRNPEITTYLTQANIINSEMLASLKQLTDNMGKLESK